VIAHSKPFIGKEEAQAAYDVIMSGQLAAGNKVKSVEKEWSKLTSSQDSAMVSSGLAALRLALLALDVMPGEEVIIPAYSCIALHNAILNISAVPILTDIKDDLTIDPKSVKEKITSKTKAIIAVHTFGARADIEELEKLEIPIIEDMAHGVFKLKSALGISSFYPTKLIASTSGGIACGSKALIDRVRFLRDYADKRPSQISLNDMPSDVSASIVLEFLPEA